MMNFTSKLTRAACAALFGLLPLLLASVAFAADSKKSFDIPAGDALPALRQFVAQSGEQLLYSAETVQGVTTNRVKGALTAREALDVMVRGTNLTVVADEQNGALSLVRAIDPRNRRAPAVADGRRPDLQANKPTNEEVVQLSPFEVNVSGDEGWVANGTLLANRMNQPLKDVPVTIDAMTKEFLQDVGAFTDFEAAKWAANVQLADETGRSDFGRYTFRGIANQWGTNRNFFRWYVPNDGFNLERIDFGRGSNSLIFGDNEPGGQATVYTKRALLGRTFTRLLAQTGSFDGYRYELDHNRQLTKAVAFRLNATRNQEGRFFDFNRFAYQGYHGTVTYRPNSRTLVRAEGEFGGHERIWGDNHHSIQERPAGGLGLNSRFTVLPGGTLIDNTTIANGTALPEGTLWNATRDRADAAGSALLLLNRDTRQVGAFSFRGFGRSANWGGPDDVEDRHYSTFSVFVEHRFTENLIAELAFNQQKQWRDGTNFSNTYLSKVDFLGRRYFDATWNQPREQNTVQTPRAMLAYNFNRLAWTKQYFVFTTEYRSDEYMSLVRSLRWLNAPGVTATTNLSATTFQPVFRYYQDGAGAATYPATFARVQAEMPAGTRIFNTGVFGQNHIAKAWALSATGSYLQGRVQTLLGVRRDTNDTADITTWTAANRTPQGEVVWPGSRHEHADRWNYSPAFRHRRMTHNLGAVYVLNASTNLYVMRSTSFRFQGSYDFLNNGVNAILGGTTEAGLKSAFLDNKLQWNLTWYDLERENAVATFGRNGVTDAQLQAAINTGVDPASPEYRTVRIGSSTDIRTQLSRGWETTFMFFPARGLNVRLAGAYTRVTQTKSFPVLRAALEAAEARRPTDPAVLSTLALMRDSLATSGADGTRLIGAGAVPFSLSYVVDYRFAPETAFRGMSLGVNGNYNGDFTLGYFGNSPNALRVAGGKMITMNASAGLQRRYFGRPVNLRLNVYNLVAPAYREAGLVTFNNGTGYMKRLYYGTPATFRLTASTEF